MTHFEWSWQRFSLGLIALSCLATGAVLMLVTTATPTGLVGILVRLGLILSAIWLAWPQVSRLGPGYSNAVLIAGLFLVAVAVARPRIFLFALGLVIIGFFLNYSLRWLSRVSDGKIKPKK